MACFIAFGVVATYRVVELTPSPYISFSDCPVNCSTENKGIGGILGHIALRIACFIAFGVVATYRVVELTPSPYISFSDCPVNCSTEDKGIGGILGHIALRTSKSSSSRSFLGLHFMD
jgi:hypothetical protein